jgi:outer membrane protein TolC
VRAELAPEIDALRAQVERQVAEQRVITARTDLEKSKAALARAIGLPANHILVSTRRRHSVL